MIIIETLQSVDGLVEHPDVVPLVGVGGPHADASYLVDLEDVGVLVPRTEVATLIKAGHSWQEESDKPSQLTTDFTSHIGTATKAGHRPQAAVDEVEQQQHTQSPHSVWKCLKM